MISYLKVKFNKMLGYFLFVLRNKQVDDYLKNQIKKNGIQLVLPKEKLLSTFQQDIMNRYFTKENITYSEN
jgi:hypothetical protein